MGGGAGDGVGYHSEYSVLLSAFSKTQRLVFAKAQTKLQFKLFECLNLNLEKCVCWVVCLITGIVHTKLVSNLICSYFIQS